MSWINAYLSSRPFIVYAASYSSWSAKHHLRFSSKFCYRSSSINYLHIPTLQTDFCQSTPLPWRHTHDHICIPSFLPKRNILNTLHHTSLLDPACNCANERTPRSPYNLYHLSRALAYSYSPARNLGITFVDHITKLGTWPLGAAVSARGHFKRRRGSHHVL